MKGIKTVAANLANRTNQLHYIESELRKVFATGEKHGQKQLIELLQEIDEYLSHNPKNYVGSGSILHQKIKSILSPEPQVYEQE